MLIEQLITLTQVPPGEAPIQWIAPVANDIGWEYLAGIIAGGAALFTFGVSRIVRFMTEPLGNREERMVEGAARLALILICFGLGALAGWRVWDWVLGGLAGAVGSGASPTLVRYIFKAVGMLPIFRGSDTSGKGSAE